MKISKEAAKELIEYSQSSSLKKDIKAITLDRHNPFFRNGKADVDAYIEFVTQFNEFINHTPKPFRRIIDKDIKL